MTISEPRPENTNWLFEAWFQPYTSSVCPRLWRSAMNFTASTVAGLSIARALSSSWRNEPKAAIRSSRARFESGSFERPIPSG